MKKCPRCAEGRLRTPAALNALSRLNNKVRICSYCGMDEAIGRGLVPKKDWPIGGYLDTDEIPE